MKDQFSIRRLFVVVLADVSKERRLARGRQLGSSVMKSEAMDPAEERSNQYTAVRDPGKDAYTFCRHYHLNMFHSSGTGMAC